MERPAWEPHTRDADFTIGRVIRPGSDEEFTPVRQFWRILEHYHQAPVEDATSRTVPPQGLGIFSRIDWLQEPTYRKFLNLCKNALEHRRPRFESETDELGFVRGRMVLDKLVDRQATHRTGVVCEFDSLTTDIHLWQVIRAGLQRVAMQAKDAQLRQQALGYEATLRDVSVHNAQTLLNERLSPTFMARIPDEQALAYRYARAIIAQQFGFGFDTDPYEAGVIANIKYDTSILWETMLEKALLQALPAGMYTLNTLPKFSYIRRPATNSAVLKRPAEIRPGFVVRTADTAHRYVYLRRTTTRYRAALSTCGNAILTGFCNTRTGWGATPTCCSPTRGCTTVRLILCTLAPPPVRIFTWGFLGCSSPTLLTPPSPWM